MKTVPNAKFRDKNWHIRLIYNGPFFATLYELILIQTTSLSDSLRFVLVIRIGQWERIHN